MRAKNYILLYIKSLATRNDWFCDILYIFGYTEISDNFNIVEFF